MPRILKDQDIVDILCEDIPSDGESLCSFQSDEEINHDHETDSMVVGDIPAEMQPELDDSFDSDDNIPLSNLDTSSAGQLPTMSSGVVQPKWKKNYRMEEPCEYTGGGRIADDILQIENITPTKLFRLFWTPDLIETISFQTNLYATQKGAPFTPTTPEEIEVFLALNLVMGIKKIPKLPRLLVFCP